jgi:hypothetical protein
MQRAGVVSSCVKHSVSGTELVHNCRQHVYITLLDLPTAMVMHTAPRVARLV